MNQRKVKASDNFRAHYFLFAHALQLIPHGGIQTVMLTQAPRSKQEIIRFFRKFSKAI
jgi:hypothetical protein